MAGDFAGHDQDRVEADRTFHGVRVRGKPVLGGVDDVRLLARGQRLGRGIETLARFHLDEDQRAAPARNDVDLADRRFEAARDDAVALGQEKGRGLLSAERPNCSAARRFGAGALPGPGGSRRSGPVIMAVLG